MRTWLATLCLWILLPSASASAGSVEVAIVPGCPTQTNGSLSDCQWRRARWAAHLHEIGAARYFITSGGAAHTPFVEAESIALGMEALGVPGWVIFRETQALHTDQNAGYALALANRLGFETIGMASDAAQARGMCSMARRWGRTCTSFPIEQWVYEVREWPELVIEPIPHERWVAEHREPRMATSQSYTSFGHYFRAIMAATFTGARPPKPPRVEPSIGGR